MATDETVSFKVEREESIEAREILQKVYEALVEKGYNPINQIVGYLEIQHILQAIMMQEILSEKSKEMNYLKKW